MQEGSVMDNSLTPAQIHHRKEAFNLWLARNGDKMGFYLLPSSRQANIRHMLLKAYNAGSNYEARQCLNLE